MPEERVRQTPCARSPPLLRVPFGVRRQIYTYIVPTQARISSSSAAFHTPKDVTALLLTNRRIYREVIDLYYSTNSFMLYLSYRRTRQIHYPTVGYINALASMIQLGYVENLVVELIVSHRAAPHPEAGYRYDTGDTKRYLDTILENVERRKGGMRGLILQSLTLVDHSGRVPTLMRQLADQIGLEVNEEIMYEPLVALARGRRVGQLTIESDYGRIKYTVNLE